MTNLDSIFKSRDITLPTKVCLVKASYGFSSSHVWMWELDCEESWALKNCCFWTVVLEKTLESPLDCKEIKPVNPKGNQSWIFTERTDAEAEAPILTNSFEKTLMLGKIEGGRRRRRQRMRSLDGITDSMDMSLSSSGSWWWTGRSGVLPSVELQRVRLDWAAELNHVHYCWCQLRKE